MITATADTRTARRYLSTVSRGLVAAAATALKRMGAAVKRKYIAALVHQGSSDVGRFQPFNFFWWVSGAGSRRAASRKPGGVLATSKLWRIDAPEPGVVRLDIVPRLQPLLDRWQHGGGNRPDVLRDWVRAVTTTQLGRAYYHAVLVPAGWPRQSALPAVPDQPEREIAEPLARAVAPLLPEWFEKNFQKVLAGKARAWSKAATA
jgi:hypothetical protein